MIPELPGPYFPAIFLAAYFLGSLPFGLLLTRAAGLGDIRATGSGNIGATNVLRTGHKTLALATLLLDGGKGALAVVAARQLAGEDAALLAAAGVLLGHVFPVWLRFRGGKGVATALGSWLALAFPVGTLACSVWLAVAALSGYSSLASLVALAAASLAAFFLAGPYQGLLGVAIVLLVIVRHRANIKRLLDGSESRIGLSKKRPAKTTGG